MGLGKQEGGKFLRLSITKPILLTSSLRERVHFPSVLYKKKILKKKKHL